MSNETDVLVIKNIIDGDINAFSQIVDAYKNMAVTLAYNILLNREDAEESAQDAFLKAYIGLRSFRQASKFSTWLYRIVVNTALNKKKQHTQAHIELTEDADHTATTSYNTGALQADAKKLVQAALKILTENERLCTSLYYLQELSVEEIRDVTGLSTANIKILLHRARKNLYNSLHEQLKDEIKTLIH